MNQRIAMLVMSVAVLLFIFSGCSTQTSKKTIELWNGTDFSNWELVLETDTVDVKDVWSAKDGVVHCAGVPKGYMRTKEAYADYTLSVDWRWVNEPGNSGVLLHAQAPPDQVWPNCIESQLKAENAGNFVLIGPGSITVDGKKYENTERFLSINKKQDGIEKPAGEWNNYKIICKADAITLYVNGVLQNAGKAASLSSGKICLQSEGAPIEFRNIKLELMD